MPKVAHRHTVLCKSSRYICRFENSIQEKKATKVDFELLQNKDSLKGTSTILIMHEVQPAM
jgi:hypothetical protein